MQFQKTIFENETIKMVVNFSGAVDDVIKAERLKLNIYALNKKTYQQIFSESLDITQVRALYEHLDQISLIKDPSRIISGRFIESTPGILEIINRLETIDPSILRLILDKFGESEKITTLLNSLSEVELQSIIKAFDFNKLENVLKIWDQNKTNKKEVSFWQRFLKENPWIISQVFSAPFAIFQNEFYVGGHYSGTLRGSKKTDFGYKNRFSHNIAIIEIKTPMTTLVEKGEYDKRSGIYPMSKDLMGSISQVLNQKDTLQKDFLQNNKGKDFECWNPKIILIIGSEDNEKLNKEQRACFELFKNSQKEIDIITFDEIFEKIKNLKDIFN